MCEESDITGHPPIQKEVGKISRSRNHQREFSGCQRGVRGKKEPEEETVEEVWRGLKAPVVVHSKSMTWKRKSFLSRLKGWQHWASTEFSGTQTSPQVFEMSQHKI